MKGHSFPLLCASSADVVYRVYFKTIRTPTNGDILSFLYRILETDTDLIPNVVCQIITLDNLPSPIGLIMRSTRDFKNVKAIKILYCALVRSKLEYCSNVWLPATQKESKKLEVVQNYFLRYLYFKIKKIGCPRETHSCVLRDVTGMTSLFLRRDVFVLVFLYKLVNNIIDCTTLLDMIQIRVPSLSNVRHQAFFYVSNFITTKYQCFVFNYGFCLFNKLYKNNVPLDFFVQNQTQFKKICYDSLVVNNN